MAKLEKIFCCQCKEKPSLLDKVIIALAFIGLFSVILLLADLLFNP